MKSIFKFVNKCGFGFIISSSINISCLKGKDVDYLKNLTLSSFFKEMSREENDQLNFNYGFGFVISSAINISCLKGKDVDYLKNLTLSSFFKEMSREEKKIVQYVREMQINP